MKYFVVVSGGSRGGATSWGSYISKILYVEMKESRPLWDMIYTKWQKVLLNFGVTLKEWIGQLVSCIHQLWFFYITDDITWFTAHFKFELFILFIYLFILFIYLSYLFICLSYLFIYLIYLYTKMNLVYWSKLFLFWSGLQRFQWRLWKK